MSISLGSLLKGVLQVNSFLDRISRSITMVILAFMSVVVFISVFYRYVLISPITWVEEITRYSMIWMVFLGVGLGIRENAHVGMTIFLDRLPPRIQQKMGIVIHILIIYFLLHCLKYGIDLTIMSKIQLTPMVKIPMYCLYIAVPIGAGLMMLQSICKIIEATNPALVKEEKKMSLHNI